MNDETIVAIATPPGQGGVGIIRLSGVQSLSIAKKITHKEALTPRFCHYCHFYSSQQQVIDLGVAVYFQSPHSFTGEDVVELHGHGSPVVLDMLVQLAIDYGARLARPGEFSERAFLNDKLDLAQAEAIADLIASQSTAAASMAVRSLQGEFSNRINQLVEELIQLRIYVEAAIDFPEEEIDFLSDGKVANDLSHIKSQLERIIATANQGVILREGMSVVLAGKPNAGKSTLLNQLAGKDIAIVTDIPGTTRDVMREHILMDEIPLHIIDTAGLRDSEDVVEKEGIKRAWQEIQQADCVLLLVDIDKVEQLPILLDDLNEQLPTRIPIITIVNKVDKRQQPPKIDQQRVYLSAKTGCGMELLKQRLKQVIGFKQGDGQFSARRRHLDALERANRIIEEGSQQLLEHRAGELLAEDLRLAQYALNEITGEFNADDLLGKIFSSFCIGK